MTETYLAKLKEEVNKLKEKFDEVKTEFLQGCEDEYININHSEAKRKDLEKLIYTWHAIVNSKQYDESAVFLRYHSVNYTGYKIQDWSFQNIKKINNAIDSGKSSFWISIRDNFNDSVFLLQHFMFLLNLNDDSLKSWFDFSKETGKLTNFQKDLQEKLNKLKPKQEAIDSFYDDFVVEKKALIENRYEELFEKQDSVTIDGNTQSVVGLSGGITAFYNNIKAKNEAIEELHVKIKGYEKEIEKQKIRFKLILGDELNNDEKKTAETEKLEELSIKNLPTRIEEYTETMKAQQEQINKMTIDTEKALGEDVDRLMVKTFQDEIDAQEKIEKNMFRGSIVTIAFGVGLLSFILHFTTATIDVLLFFRLLFATPVLIMYLLFKKKHDEASLLVSEYRHKKCVVKAMIGYRAKYQTSQDQFYDSFKKEYGQFFDKTFTEINNNPSDKVHKLHSRKFNSIKDLTHLSKNIGQIIRDFNGTVANKTS
jgi:hypothetical protein